MFSKTLVLVLLLLSIGCGKAPRDAEQQVSGRPENFQLPNAVQSARQFAVYYRDFGINDTSAPNDLLFNWKSVTPLDASRSELLPSTAQALHDDSALAIDLYDVPLTEELRSQLPRLHHVQWLRLSAGVVHEDLTWIGRMKQLRGLSLTRANLSGANFEALAEIASLQFLSLSGAEFSELEFGTLPRFKKLEVLCLSGSNVNDDCSTHLAKIRLPSLRSLSLEFSSVSEEGMRHFCKVYNLEYMNLYASRKISAGSVDAICKMKRLRKLGIGGTGISPNYERSEAVAELIRRLPKCSVDYGD